MIDRILEHKGPVLARMTKVPDHEGNVISGPKKIQDVPEYKGPAPKMRPGHSRMRRVLDQKMIKKKKSKKEHSRNDETLAQVWRKKNTVNHDLDDNFQKKSLKLVHKNGFGQ
ncbi:hypothetical protein RRG08_049526 [Elysia crispata]|uniref:Uncharacterized protein n=1 Tax=Elysia crispata TaxID=231223 RepID=A0AAE1BF84_9GAST|nr:hypothetical protein RRG08_049526 [Elysia crispata]